MLKDQTKWTIPSKKDWLHANCRNGIILYGFLNILVINAIHSSHNYKKSENESKRRGICFLHSVHECPSELNPTNYTWIWETPDQIKPNELATGNLKCCKLGRGEGKVVALPALELDPAAWLDHAWLVEFVRSTTPRLSGGLGSLVHLREGIGCIKD